MYFIMQNSRSLKEAFDSYSVGTPDTVHVAFHVVWSIEQFIVIMAHISGLNILGKLTDYFYVQRSWA